MKEIEFFGRTLDVIRDFPADAKHEAGHQLDRVQRGNDPTDWKPMSSIGKDVREIRIQDIETEKHALKQILARYKQ
jgi:phage-related protein